MVCCVRVRGREMRLGDDPLGQVIDLAEALAPAMARRPVRQRYSSAVFDGCQSHQPPGCARRRSPIWRSAGGAVARTMGRAPCSKPRRRSPRACQAWPALADAGLGAREAELPVRVELGRDDGGVVGPVFEQAPVAFQQPVPGRRGDRPVRRACRIMWWARSTVLTLSSCTKPRRWIRPVEPSPRGRRRWAARASAWRSRNRRRAARLSRTGRRHLARTAGRGRGGSARSDICPPSKVSGASSLSGCAGRRRAMTSAPSTSAPRRFGKHAGGDGEASISRQFVGVDGDLARRRRPGRRRQAAGGARSSSPQVRRQIVQPMRRGCGSAPSSSAERSQGASKPTVASRFSGRTVSGRAAGRGRCAAQRPARPVQAAQLERPAGGRSGGTAPARPVAKRNWSGARTRPPAGDTVRSVVGHESCGPASERCPGGTPREAAHVVAVDTDASARGATVWRVRAGRR